jgi:hypothetical protein
LDDIQTYFEDIIESVKVYYYCLGTCLVVAIIYNILLRYFARLIIWVSIIGCGAGMVGLTLFLRSYHENNYGPGSTRS